MPPSRKQKHTPATVWAAAATVALAAVGFSAAVAMPMLSGTLPESGAGDGVPGGPRDGRGGPTSTASSRATATTSPATQSAGRTADAGAATPAPGEPSSTSTGAAGARDGDPAVRETGASSAERGPTSSPGEEPSAVPSAAPAEVPSTPRSGGPPRDPTTTPASEPGPSDMPRSPDPSVPTSSSSGDPSGAGPSETTSADPAAPTSGTAEPTSSAPAQSPPAGNAAGSLSVSPQGDGSNLVLLSEPDGGFAGPVRVSLTVADGTLLDRAAEGTDCDRVGSSLWRCDVADAQTLQFLVRASGASDGGPVTLRVEATDGAERTFAGDVTLPSVG